MKKKWTPHIIAAGALVVFIVLGLACASSSNKTKTGTGTLDSAILQATKEINDTLPAGTKVALLNFNSDSDVFSDYVIEEMSIALVKGKKLVVVDRKEIELIRNEMNFQMSGEVSDESAQKIGAKLGAQSIVSGSMVNVGENYRFRTKAINVNSAVIETQSSIDVNSDSKIKYLLSQGKKAPAPAAVAQGGAQAIPAQAQPSAPAAPTPTYAIGDTGPAGGLIFYDKKNNSGGWRYLEAAPLGAEFQAKWSIHGTVVDNTNETIGSGKQNTQLIIEKFSQTPGEWDTAPQKVDDLVFNKFDDWFLPSKAELDMMYGNLKRKNLGDFKNDWYCTSSFAGYYVNTLWRQNFKDGEMRWHDIRERINVRPIRQF